VPPYTIDRHWTRSPWELKSKVTLSESHGCELTNRWKESQHPARRPSTASKYSSKLARLRPPCSHHHGLQVHLQTRSIAASKYISNITPLRPPSASPNSLDRSLRVRMIRAFKCISPNSLYHGLQLHLQTCLITASKCSSKLAWLPPWNVSPNSFNYGLLVQDKTCSITASEGISVLPSSSSSGACRIAS